MEIRQLYFSFFLLQVGHNINQPILDARPKIRPPASPTKLAGATIRRTVVVLKMTKVTKKEANQSQIGINSKS